MSQDREKVQGGLLAEVQGYGVYLAMASVNGPEKRMEMVLAPDEAEAVAKRLELLAKEARANLNGA